MADYRIPNSNNNNRDNVTLGGSGSPGIGKDIYDSNGNYLSRLIVSSSIYQQAYQLFSSDIQYGEPFLLQLKLIPESFSVRDENFWDLTTDLLGGTSDYDNLIKDAFNQAMDEIRVLVQNYYNFINSLPETQVEQLAAAGINAGVTGEGINPSSMSSDPVSGLSENPSNISSSNQSLSDGISSFVEFITAMSSLSQGLFSSKHLMGMLDIAEREGYNKQEVHDLMMSQYGVTAPSPYRVLNLSNAPIVGDLATVAQSKSRADAAAVEGVYEVNMGTDPDHNYSFEIKTGQDVLNEVSRFKLATDLGQAYINNIRTGVQQLYADSLAYLESEYNLSNYQAQTSQADFNKDFFNSRNGSIEGKSQTSITKSLMSIREAERKIKEFDAWIAEYKLNTLDSWSDSIKNTPALAPFFYKAVFDFDMQDTFYHMSPWTMGLKYGMESLKGFTDIISNIMGFARPTKPRITRTSSTSSGPRGVTETFTESVTE